MKNVSLILGLAFLLSLGVFVACTKSNNSGGTTRLTIRLTDTPYNAQEVNVDIREVRVRFSDDSSEYRSLTTNSNIYNLLDFQNGVDTVLATGTVPAGNLKEVRLVLGGNNSIKINNVVYPLTIPSGEESGLKLKMSKNLTTSLDSLLIHFDANSSIHTTGSGKYMLKPVLRLK